MEESWAPSGLGLAEQGFGELSESPPPGEGLSLLWEGLGTPNREQNSVWVLPHPEANAVLGLFGVSEFPAVPAR